MSTPFRTSGSSSGAKPKRNAKSKAPSAVSVALQLPPPAGLSDRLVEKFHSDSTVWKVLRQFESRPATADDGAGGTSTRNFTARAVAQVDSGNGTGAGRLYYETPVLNVAGRELATLADFRKTLSQLGYNSGGVLMRLAFRKTDKPFESAMEDIGRFFEDIDGHKPKPRADDRGGKKEPGTAQRELGAADEAHDGREAGAPPPPESVASTTKVSSPPMAEEFRAVASASEQTDVDPSPSDSLQPLSVYSAPTTATPSAARTHESDFAFTPSIAQAQLHQAHLQASSRNRRLLSDEELADQAAASAARLAAISSVSIRVRFPDNTQAEWRFSADASGATLYRAVRGVMAAENQPFRLVLPGKKVALRDAEGGPDDGLIKGYRLAGGVMINFLWDDGVPSEVRQGPFLRSSVEAQARPIVVPHVAEATGTDDEATTEESRKQGSSDKPDREGDEGKLSHKKVPKWLKLAKK